MSEEEAENEEEEEQEAEVGGEGRDASEPQSLPSLPASQGVEAEWLAMELTSAAQAGWPETSLPVVGAGATGAVAQEGMPEPGAEMPEPGADEEGEANAEEEQAAVVGSSWASAEKPARPAAAETGVSSSAIAGRVERQDVEAGALAAELGIESAGQAAPPSLEGSAASAPSPPVPEAPSKPQDDASPRGPAPAADATGAVASPGVATASSDEAQAAVHKQCGVRLRKKAPVGAHCTSSEKSKQRAEEFRPIATPARRGMATKSRACSSAAATADGLAPPSGAPESGEKVRRCNSVRTSGEGGDEDRGGHLLSEAGHTLRPALMGCHVVVVGDGWGGPAPGSGYEAVVTEADNLTFTVVAVGGDEAWKETHVLQEYCVPVVGSPLKKEKSGNEAEELGASAPPAAKRQRKSEQPSGRAQAAASSSRSCAAKRLIGSHVVVVGDGWGGPFPGGGYEAIVTEADNLSFTVISVNGSEAWTETHVLQEYCVPVEGASPPAVAVVKATPQVDTSASKRQQQPATSSSAKARRTK